jgi:hypothetical protein
MRTWLGVVVAVVGAVLLVVGWYAVSGESDVARQMPYIASACIPGAALVVSGAVLVAAERWRDAAGRTDQKIDALYALFTEPAGTVEAAAPVDAAADGLVALDGTPRYHRAACPLVTGKPVHSITAADVTDEHLEPCPVCEPPAPVPV